MPSHRAAARHRAARRRRVSALGGAVLMTLVIGSAAVGVLPQLKGPQAASADAGASQFVQAALDTVTVPRTTSVESVEAVVAADVALPKESGTGRRIVFSESMQRVWLVGSDGEVDRTYPVSGSKYDNLEPGSYLVQSRSRRATAFDASGTMEYFVRFATGRTAPIGFHTVPVDNEGRLEQTKAQLGTPLSAGCVRQWRDDAVALWKFAPVGTRVVVTA